MGLKERVRRFIGSIVDEQLSKSKSRLYFMQQNIIENIKYVSCLQTAKYVLDKMHTTSIFSSKIELYDYIFDSYEINGEVLEFGVFQGESINYFSTKVPQLKLIGFDSFEGLPEDWRHGFNKGSFDLNGQLPTVRDNVSLVKGWFNESLPKFLESNPISKIGLLHIDCDLYSSTKTIFNLLGNRIAKDTVIIFDEYFNYPGWEQGEFKAFQEFVEKYNLTYKYIGYNSNHEQVAVIIQ